VIAEAPNVLNFGGSVSQTIDDRQRIALPAHHLKQLRAALGGGPDDPIDVVVAVSYRGAVSVYPVDEWKKEVARVEELAKTMAAARELLELYQQMAEPQTLDKQNRFRVPIHLVRAFKLEDSVLVKGTKNHLQVVKSATFEAQLLGDLSRIQAALDVSL